MKSITEGRTHLLRLEKGEEIVEAIAKYCAERQITAGSVEAIGAVNDATLGFFDFANKEYVKRDFNGELEIVSLCGNISIAEGKPFPHLHAVLAGRIGGRAEEDFSAFGGHFFRGVVSATLEVYLTAFGRKVERKFSAETGLRLLDM